MKRITHITFLIFLLVSVTLNAQFKKKGAERIKALKIAHITTQLDLTEQEAIQFWPIYNNFDKKMMELRKKRHHSIRQKIKQEEQFDNFSEAEAKDIVNTILSLEEERYIAKKEFLTKIKSVISHKKILQLEIAEHDFNKKLFRKLRHKAK